MKTRRAAWTTLAVAFLVGIPALAVPPAQVPATAFGGAGQYVAVSSADVVGAASSSDNALARFDGVTGKILQNSVVIVGDTGDASFNGGAGDLDAAAFTSSEDGLTPASGGGTTNFLRADGTWVSPGSGSGDVVGPGSSTDEGIARFDTTTGKLIQNSTSTLSDTGTITLGGTIIAAAGSTTTPTLAWPGASSNSGVFLAGADNPAIVTDGTQRWDVSTTAITSTLPYLAAAGLVTAPSYAWTGSSSNTGWWLSATDTASLAIDGVTVITAGPAAGDRITIAGGALASTFNLFDMTATMSATSAAQVGARVDITGAGTDTNAHNGVLIELAAGYTGAGNDTALQGTNRSLGTGTTPAANTAGSFGVNGEARGAGAGHNAGAVGLGTGSTTRNIGVLGRGFGNATGESIGVYGFAATSAGTPNRVGGVFALSSTDIVLTSTTVALLADNGAEAFPILHLRDNATVVLAVVDGGQMQITGGSVGTPAYSFLTSGSQNSGAYSIGTDDYGFSVDGVLAMRFQTTGVTWSTPFLATVTGGTNGLLLSATGSGSAAGTTTAFRSTFAAGYTGSSGTAAINASNANAGTGATAVTAGLGNFGVSTGATATTVGDNVGAFGFASGGNRNYGLFGRTIVDKASVPNVGVVGISHNAGASGVQVGGYFAVYSTVADPTPAVSAGLVASNGDTTNPIFVAADGTTTFWQIIDGGTVVGAGGVRDSHRTVNDATVTMLATDYLIGLTGLSASRTVNLQAAATAGEGRRVVVKDEDGTASVTNTIVVDGNASETIDGATTQTIVTARGRIEIYCTGTTWQIISASL